MRFSISLTSPEGTSTVQRLVLIPSKTFFPVLSVRYIGIIFPVGWTLTDFIRWSWGRHSNCLLNRFFYFPDRLSRVYTELIFLILRCTSVIVRQSFLLCGFGAGADGRVWWTFCFDTGCGRLLGLACWPLPFRAFGVEREGLSLGGGE